jgi:hypothetical protein
MARKEIRQLMFDCCRVEIGRSLVNAVAQRTEFCGSAGRESMGSAFEQTFDRVHAGVDECAHGLIPNSIGSGASGKEVEKAVALSSEQLSGTRWMRCHACGRC